LFSLGVGANVMLLWAVVGSVMLQVTMTLLPWTQAVFGLASLAPEDWFMIGALGMAPLPAMEIGKALVRWRESPHSIPRRPNGNS
jgi:magnesium-transporting ATPase (P-type)